MEFTIHRYVKYAVSVLVASTTMLTVIIFFPDRIETARGAPITIGETSILPSGDSGNGNLILSTQVSLSQTATIESLSFYVTTASGNLRLGIYDATGAGGNPG